MGIGRLGVKLDGFSCFGTPLFVQVETPEHTGTSYEHLVVGDVLA
jgi:hypothetical protein